MWRDRDRLLRVVPGVLGGTWLPLSICVLFFLTITVLLPIHQCIHHHNVPGPIGTCNCPCHNLTTTCHEGPAILLLVGLAVSALVPHIDLGILPFQSLEYHPALQRAPPLPAA